MRFASVAALAALFAISTTANAAVYTLTPAGGGVNSLSIVVLGLIPLDTDLSGTIDVNQSPSPDPIVNDFSVNSANITATAFNYSNALLGTITSTPLGAGASSGPIAVTNPPGSFDASGISIALNSGTIIVNIPFISPNTINIDLSTPIAFDAGGTGSIVGSVAGVNQYDYTLTIPINFATVLDPNGLAVPIGVIGQLVATATVPEPTSGLFLACMVAGAGSVVRRRRR